MESERAMELVNWNEAERDRAELATVRLDRAERRRESRRFPKQEFAFDPEARKAAEVEALWGEELRRREREEWAASRRGPKGLEYREWTHLVEARKVRRRGGQPEPYEQPKGEAPRGPDGDWYVVP